MLKFFVSLVSMLNLPGHLERFRAFKETKVGSFVIGALLSIAFIALVAFVSY